MRQRTLGKTGIEVSELGLGTWALAGEAYGPIPYGQAEKVIERGVQMGITLFDTASVYGDGTMESILGQTLPASALVISRIGTDTSIRPPFRNFSKSFLEKDAETSLRRLKGGETPPRVALLLHNPSEQALEREESFEPLRALAASGDIVTWGVSVGSVRAGELALQAGAPVISLAYNVLHVQLYRGLKALLDEHKPGLLFHSILGYGLLTGKWPQIKEFPHGDHRAHRWPGGALRGRIQLLSAIRPLVSGPVTTLRGAALRFALNEELLSSAILGARTEPQLDQLVREGRSEPPYLPPAALTALEARLSQSGEAR